MHCGVNEISNVWPNRDPLGERPGSNLYAYVKNNPLGYFDPNGLKELTACDCQTFRKEALDDLAKEFGYELGSGFIEEGLTVIFAGAIGRTSATGGTIVFGIGTSYSIYDVGHHLSERIEKAQNIQRLYNLCVEQVVKPNE
jgi:uncharacterized protein RhaS with RHS repeats